MAVGKYSRADGRKSTNYCSPAILVTFLGLCLIGVWMLMSSSVVPVQKTDLSSQDSRSSDLIEKIVDRFSRQFEDSSGELAEEATKEEDNTVNSQDESNSEEKESENSVVENQEEKIVKEISEGNNKDDEDSKKEADDEGNGESKGESESNSETEANSSEQLESEETVEEPKKKIEDQSGDQSEILKETTVKNGAWSTQAAESESEKESQKSKLSKDPSQYNWKLCNVTAGSDYIPCLDNLQAIKKLPSRNHYQHRERHCPDEAPTCLVSLPEGYRQSVKWPKSREQVYSTSSV